MRNNIVNAVFRGGTACRTSPVYQYDYGIILKFHALDLPNVYEVHFSNHADDGDAITVLGNEDGALIPDELLLSGETVYAWLYLHTTSADGETVYSITIPVIARAKPSDIEPTPVEQSVIDQAIAALNTGVATVENIAEEMPVQIEEALTTAKESGEFDGFSPKVSLVKSGRTSTLSITDVDGEHTTDITDGADGEDGYSPTASVVQTSSGATVTITDKNGITTADIVNGQNGEDGFSPTAEVTKVGNKATITITDQNGVHTADVYDGAKGDKGDTGDDGYSPSATVSKSGKTATITITDKNGTTTATVSDGTDGVLLDDFNGLSNLIIKDFNTYDEYSENDYVRYQGFVFICTDDHIGPWDYNHFAEVPVGDFTDRVKRLEARPAGGVTDVQVNGSSVVSGGVANVPIAASGTPGVVAPSYGVAVDANGNLTTSKATLNYIKQGGNGYAPIVPDNQHNAVFYGLAKAASDTTQSQSSNAVGNYTDAAKIAIQKMLGIYQPPWELLNDITLTEESCLTLTADDNGTPYNLLGVYIRVLYAANLTTASAGYGRYRFDDINRNYIQAETGKYTTNANTSFKSVLVERKGNLAIANYTRQATVGGNGAWVYKDSSGIDFNLGNIVKIMMANDDPEPAGTRIQIYGQRAY